MAKNKNKNIIPIKDISELKDEISYNSFDFKEYFSLIAKLIPNIEKERLEIVEFDKEQCKNGGLIYVFVIDDKIFKIGQSITNIKKRVQSYNCGKTEYRINGTNSTTNYFVLQSFLRINKEILVYAYFPPKLNYEIFGKKFNDESYPPAKKAENLILEMLKQRYKKLPIGCTQK